ncbi:MAG: pyridoxal-phosphate dependent enzyme, partial [Thermomicrobiaceae bacterium]
YETTGPELWEQSAGRITHFVAGVGTGGTISGVSKFLKEQNPDIKVIGADPEGSIYTSPNDMRPYKVEGIGEDFWPGTFESSLVDEFLMVTDRDSFMTARRFSREEGVLLGGSGGTAVWAALHVAQRDDNPDNFIVVLLPDSGRGYLSKLYSDDWMRENGFLSRFDQPARARVLLGARHDQDMPAVVTVSVSQTVEEAINLLRRYRISQLPVVRDTAPSDNGLIPVHSVAGSIQERTLLDQVFRHPAAMKDPVSTVMDPPFSLVDADEEVERVFPLLAAGSPAVLVNDDGDLAGIVTRSDLLDFLAGSTNAEG